MTWVIIVGYVIMMLVVWRLQFIRLIDRQNWDREENGPTPAAFFTGLFWPIALLYFTIEHALFRPMMRDTPGERAERKKKVDKKLAKQSAADAKRYGLPLPPEESTSYDEHAPDCTDEHGGRCKPT